GGAARAHLHPRRAQGRRGMANAGAARARAGRSDRETSLSLSGDFGGRKAGQQEEEPAISEQFPLPARPGLPAGRIRERFTLVRRRAPGIPGQGIPGSRAGAPWEPVRRQSAPIAASSSPGALAMDLKALSLTLGLSPTTVSRALNGYTDVSEVTRA